MKAKLSNKKIYKNQLAAIFFHIALGYVAILSEPLLKAYLIIVFLYFFYKIVVSSNKTFYVIAACCYITGGEVFFRMSDAMILYETGKYGVILFCFIGILYQGFKVKASIYLIFSLLLLPGIMLSLNYYSQDLFTFRKNILFNLSGPLCLIAASLYCYSRKLRFEQLQNALNYMVYPLLATTVYIFLYAPNLEGLNTTSSNTALSGGFGPNQVSTVLGLGIFILFTRFLIPYKNKWVHIIMMFSIVAMAYRALLTFSRGGVLVAVLMAVAFTIILYFVTGLKTKAKVTLKLVGTIGLTIGIWVFTVVQTGGLIENRYTNKNASGIEKEDLTTGRLELFMAEVKAFLDNPILGGGVGAAKVYHKEEVGESAASHNEVSRMIGEHGLFGIIGLLILLLTPLLHKFSGNKNIYFYPFMIFWFLTIFHSAMRIAAPGFIYGLSLLSLVYTNDKKKKKVLTVSRQ